MIILHRLRSILHWLLHRTEAERQLDEELQGFVDASAAEKVRRGVPPAEARRLAVIELGGVEQVKERVRAHRHGAMFDDVGRDVRYMLRAFTKDPGFVAVIVLTLSLGIGANTAIFSLIDALMLRSLPVPNPQQLVQLQMRFPEDGAAVSGTFSYAIVRALAEDRESFTGFAGFSAYEFNVGAGDTIRKVPGALVTGAYYDTLELKPAIGRLLSMADDEPGVPLVVVLSDAYWERQFLRSPAAIGQPLLLNGASATIIGVTPPGFVGANVGSTADLTATVAGFSSVNREAAALRGPGNFWLRVLARPAPGTSVSEAEARLTTQWWRRWDSLIAAHWSASRRLPFANVKLQLSPGGTGWSIIRETYSKPLMVLMAVAAMVLLVACANVASLMLARGSARQREIAVRLAIGAGRGRIVRQLLVESVMLSMIGAASGILLAWATNRMLLRTVFPAALQVTFDLTPDWRVLGYTATVAVVTGLLFGVVPAIQSVRAGPWQTLKSAGAHTSSSRVLSSLVIAQVSLSLLLLVGAGLFAGTLRNLQRFDPGFKTEGVLVIDLGEGHAVPKELLDDVEAVPGIVGASLATHTPFNGWVWSDIAVPKGRPIPERDTAWFIGAGPRFLEVIQTPLIAGREFGIRDTTGAPQVAIVNETYARRYFPGRVPLGEYLSAVVRGDRKELAIVGVARDTSAAGFRRASPPTIYVPYRQLTSGVPTTLVVRARGTISQIAAAVRQKVQPRFPDRPIEVVPLSAQVDTAMKQERVMATLASAFGYLSLVLACVGLYGLLAYSVTRRTRELAICVALGAPRQRVVVMVLGSAIRLVTIGVVLGLPAAWVAARVIQSMLFGVTPGDPATIAGAMLLLCAAALSAAYLPTRRAARVSPLTALRQE